MSNQLVKKDYSEGYRKVFPKTFIDAIKDRESGLSLTEILQGFNMYFLSYNGNKAETRNQVPPLLRKEGLWITYVLYDHTVVSEWYDNSKTDDDSWGSDENWRIASNALVGDISVSADGYWVINSIETTSKAQGERGTTPLLRIYDNKLQVSYTDGKTYDYINDTPVYTKFKTEDNKLHMSTDLGNTWETISDYIAAQFRWIQEGTSNNIGKIQISRDEGKTWSNLTNSFSNNLHISRYIGANESLPTTGIAEGTIYMKGPYYDENDTNNDYPIYRMWVYAWKGNTLAWQDNGEFQSIVAGVVQEKGDSELNVMSQAAVTKELTELESEVNSISGSEEILEQTLSAGSYPRIDIFRNYRQGDKVKFEVLTPNNLVIAYLYEMSATSEDVIVQHYISATSGIVEISENYQGRIRILFAALSAPTQVSVRVTLIGEINELDEKVETLESKAETLESDVETLESELESEIYEMSINLYDSSKQTEDTISPHYYVNGYPYSTAEFDNKFNATALIEVKSSTQYTIGLVPQFGSIVKPWYGATHGLFFYDSAKNYISGTTDNTFTTPSNARYIRFNYYIEGGMSLTRLNERCMLVIGDELPAEYVAYSKVSLSDKIKNTEDNILKLVRFSQKRNLYFRIIEDGIEIFQKSGKSKDLAFVLKRKGGNNLFDFYQILKRDNDSEIVGTNIADYALMASTTTDWHAPFKLLADNNADGDNKNADGAFNNYFTGGNHQYNNSGGGSTSTAKSVRLVFYADGRQVELGAEGYANHIRMEWSNQVQGQNTTKADGSGRYILQENHVLHYDGITFKSAVELIPLEDIHITTWYGLQAVYSNLFTSLRFVDSTNRKENALPQSVSCGNMEKCRGMILKGDELLLFMDVDQSLDLGARVYNNGVHAAFAENYGKVYFGIISTSQCAMAKGDAYYLEGSYSFNL